MAAISLAFRTILDFLDTTSQVVEQITWVYDSKATARVVLSDKTTLATTADAKAAQEARRAIEAKGIIVRDIWITSHDKPMPSGWHAPSDFTEADLRLVNDKADTACTRLLATTANSSNRADIATQRKAATQFADAAFKRCEEVLGLWAPHLQAVHTPPEP